MRKSRLKLFAAVSLALAAFPAVGFAQGDYPNKPVRFLVPYGPGGSIDVTARIVGNAIAPILGQQIVVDNKPGASGQIGTELAVRAPADGYIVLIHGNILASEVCLKKDLPYDIMTDMTPIMTLSETPFVLVAHPSVPANGIKEFVDYSKANPNAVKYGSAGVGSSGHLRGELFKLETGADMKLIPYKDSSSTVLGLLRNDVQIAVETLPGSLAQIQEGKLKLLAVGEKRLSILPNTPSMRESGFKPLPGQWIAAYVSAKTPPDAVKKLSDAFAKALADPNVKEQFGKMVFEIGGAGGPDTLKKLKDEKDAWCKTVQAAGITLVQ
jgi:tripartite-type tricarboxylate transporter receptor subunit TctC